MVDKRLLTPADKATIIPILVDLSQTMNGCNAIHYMC